MTTPSFEQQGQLLSETHSNGLATAETDHPTPPKPPKTLSRLIALVYAFGHYFNDMANSMWLTYSILYYQTRLNGSQPGILLLIGHLAAGLISPIIGYLSDRFAESWPFCRFGRHKTWHFFGTLLTTSLLSAIFCPSPFGADKSLLQFFYYCTLVILFQTGYAASQVSHVALLNDLTPLQNERIVLNSVRQAATVVANLSMYFQLWLLTPSDGKIPSFTYLSLSVTVLGITVNALFYVFLSDPTAKSNRTEVIALADVNIQATNIQQAPSINRPGKAAWHRWFVSIGFWTITGIYTLGRMYVIVSQVMMPLYSTNYLNLTNSTLSTIPLVVNSARLCVTYAINKISIKFGSRVTLLAGVLMGLGAMIWISVGDQFESYNSVQIYFVASAIGIAGTALLISGLALNSELIGDNNAATNAFVFAAMCLFDKAINGTTIFFMVVFKPPKQSPDEAFKPQAYYKVFKYSLGSATMLGIILLLLILRCTRYGRASTSQ